MSRAGIRGLWIGALAVALCAAVTGTAAAKPTGSEPGNSSAAKACQKGGWANLVRGDGTSFSSEAECKTHAAQGGTLLPKPTGTLNFDISASTIDTCGVANCWGTLTGSGLKPGTNVCIDYTFEGSPATSCPTVAQSDGTAFYDRLFLCSPSVSGPFVLSGTDAGGASISRTVTGSPPC